MPCSKGLAGIKTLLFLFLLHLVQFTGALRGSRLPITRLLTNWDAYYEMSKFLSYSFQKFGSKSSSCHTIIWDYELSSVVDYINFCNKDACGLRYLIKFEKIGNVSDNFTITLVSAYKQKCQSYVLLLSNNSDVLDLLRYGDEFRTIDTRGRFLIWYGDEDKSFESDEIWRKIPNVVFFHTKLNRRPSRNKKISFKIQSLKWPVIPNSTDLSIRVIDFWRNGGLAKNEDNWFPDKTSDLKNVTLKVLTVEHPPSIIKYRDSKDNIEYAGSEFEVLKELSLIMNFNFDIIDADPMTKWGGVVMDSNGSRFTYGAVSRLFQGDVDVALGAFIVLKKNLELLDMSIPLDVACTSFLTANPLPRPRYLALILPFQYTLWILVATVCLVFAPLALFGLAKLPTLRDVKEYRIFTTKWNCVITSISIISQVALHLWPRGWAMRQLVGWYWIFCLLITLGYRCAMVSFLTIPLFEPVIDNLKQLASSGLRVGGWGPEMQNLFTQQIQSDDVDTDRARDRLAKVYELVENYDTGLNLVAERKFAMYENIRYLKFMLKTRNVSKVGTPTMRVMKQCILPVHIGIAYQKNSPIAPKINTHIRRFQESGLLKKWSQRLIAKTKQYYKARLEHETMNSEGGEEGEEENDEESGTDEAEAAAAAGNKQRKERVLSMRDLQGAIYLIIFGTSLSVLAFFVEIFTNQARQKKKLLALKNRLANKIPKIGKKLPQITNPITNPKDIFTRISERVLKVKTDREYNTILREMGLLPKRKDEFRWNMRRRWRIVKNFGRDDLFPYTE